MACLAAIVGLASPAAAAPPAENQQPSAAAENTARQIGALQDIKVASRATGSKVDSKLLVELKARANRSAMSSALPKLQSGVKVTGNTTLVDIRATVSNDLKKALTNAGATLRSVSTRY